MYAFTQDVPIHMDTYHKIREALGAEPPKGLVVHLVLENGDGLRYIDVWQSEADFRRFQEERLHPAVRPILQQVFPQGPPGEPVLNPLKVTDVWVP
jgi:hypothetical protein